jgi:hypothetical protein
MSGLVQDSEIAFVIPITQIEKIAIEFEGTDKGLVALFPFYELGSHLFTKIC